MAESNVRFERVIESRLRAIKAATPLTHDMAVISAHQLQAETLVEQLRVVLKAIDRFDEEIAVTAAKLPDYACCSNHSLVLAQHWHRGYWLASARTASAMQAPRNYSNTSALPR